MAVFAAPSVNSLDMKLEGQETLEYDLPNEGLRPGGHFKSVNNL